MSNMALILFHSSMPLTVNKSIKGRYGCLKLVKKNYRLKNLVDVTYFDECQFKYRPLAKHVLRLKMTYFSFEGSCTFKYVCQRPVKLLIFSLY